MSVKVGNEIISIENMLTKTGKVKVKDETFKKLMWIYSIALTQIEKQIMEQKEEYKELYQYDLIQYTKSRIKDPQSILNKMQRKHYDCTYKNLVNKINDIAGLRIICPLKQDVFKVKTLIEQCPEIRILKEKDYITYPKESGYASYHMIVEIPIIIEQVMIYVKVEIQIRTMAMDFWSTLEHKMKYKPQGKVNTKVSKELIACAKMIQKLDNRMMKVYKMNELM